MDWDERYRTGSYEPREEPSALLQAAAEAGAFVAGDGEGRALDVACGVGRNAVYLAERGFEVDAVDASEVALGRARERASEHGVEVNWIKADLDEFAFEPSTYDVVAVSFFLALDRLPDIKESLAPEGVLTYEHHLRTTVPVDRGPSTDRYRLRSNDLLRACLDLTVLYYREGIREVERGSMAVASLVARNSTGGAQAYPTEIGGSRPQR